MCKVNRDINRTGFVYYNVIKQTYKTSGYREYTECINEKNLKETILFCLICAFILSRLILSFLYSKWAVELA